MFKKCAPLFLQLATNRPRFWSTDFRIHIRSVLYIGEYDTALFAFFDTISSLAFGVPPLMDYDTSLSSVDEKETYRTVERIYGCPAFIVVLLARINSWRTSRWISQSNWNGDDWREIEKALLDWNPAIEATDVASNFIGRLAVQESWRQAVRIYLYMVRISYALSLICRLTYGYNRACATSTPRTHAYSRPYSRLLS